jgi:diguanylate cyclase (GGDEF)-like protein
MAPFSPEPGTAALVIGEAGALLFGLVFLFLYRQSRVVYFGLWAIAWGLQLAASFFGFELLRTAHHGWLAPYATFEFAFVIVLISAARAGFATGIKDWRTVLRLISILPVFVALVWALGGYSRQIAYHAAHALAPGGAYLYNCAMLRRKAGAGARAFRFSLAALAVVFLARGAVGVWAGYPRGEAYYEFALHCLLAFAAMAMWSENQIDRIRELRAEVDHLRLETQRGPDLDRLTGLLNQDALARRIEAAGDFAGVVAVCDMDNFKDINDRYGHLAGDEILRNIGNLLQSWIRQEDEAFRWGGDEFVVLFHDQRSEVVRARMRAIEARLREFRVRGYGALPISFSWGIADSRGRILRDTLDEADRNMYALKRSRIHGAALRADSAAER